MSDGQDATRPDSRTHVVARALRKLADEVEKNDPARFGGCYLIIPPTGEERDLLILNAKQDVSLFWASVKTTCEIALAEMQDQERARNPALFARR